MKNDPRIEEFKKSYPNLFKEGCLRIGFNLPVGWEVLVRNLSNIIEYHIAYDLSEEIREEIYVVQIKEKFGSLRFYLNKSTPYIDGAIAVTESLSSEVCETCSKPGVLRKGTWIRTMCDSCCEIK